MRTLFRTSDTLQVFTYGKTRNNKIEGDKKRKIVQSYTFSRHQFELVLNDCSTMKEFFNSADTNCLDCPYNVYGKCYTHKFNQYVGFISMLRSIIRKYKIWDDIPTYTDEIGEQTIKICKDKFIRFGTYGEPSLHPFELIKNCVSVSESWTGYTHQWHRKPELSAYFMASTHSIFEEKIAKDMGFRSFIATDEKIEGAVNCPASKEGGYKSTCSKCVLCSGTEGKGKKSVYIFNH